MVAPVSMNTMPAVARMPEPVAINEYPSHYEYIYETKADSGKKWGVGIASACIPGLGQAINGQWGKGIGFFAGVGALTLASSMSMLLGVAKDSAKGIAGMLVGMLGASGLVIWSIIDAVKNAKETSKHIVPKQMPATIQPEETKHIELNS